MSAAKLVSTTALSKLRGLSTNDFFKHFTRLGLIIRKKEEWELSDLGHASGGQYKESKQFGRYIVWPEDIEINLEANKTEEKNVDKKKVDNKKPSSLTASQIGKHFELSPRKINSIFSELGWIKKALKGWEITTQGLKQKGVQAEDPRSGIPFVRWPETILKNKPLIDTAENLSGKVKEPEKISQGQAEFREKFVAKHRATDGHFVRSKAEMLIDNWLYMAEIVHSYERRLPIEEDVYSDFYLPSGKVYIEYWGIENDRQYLARKEKKIEIYNKYDFNLIQLQDKEVMNLDDVLPRLLLKFGIEAY